MPTLIDECIAQSLAASSRDPIDWDAIRGAVLTLGREARTKNQNSAVDLLKRATDTRTVGMAVSAIRDAFLQGKPDVDGRPCRF